VLGKLRLIEALEIGYFLSACVRSEKPAAVGAVDKVEIRRVYGFPSAVKKSARGFFHERLFQQLLLPTVCSIEPKKGEDPFHHQRLPEYATG
jgi:hypothetical protein